jgi:hypothetical protein
VEDPAFDASAEASKHQAGDTFGINVADPKGYLLYKIVVHWMHCILSSLELKAVLLKTFA